MHFEIRKSARQKLRYCKNGFCQISTFLRKKGLADFSGCGMSRWSHVKCVRLWRSLTCKQIICCPKNWVKIGDIEPLALSFAPAKYLQHLDQNTYLGHSCSVCANFKHFGAGCVSIRHVTPFLPPPTWQLSTGVTIPVILCGTRQYSQNLFFGQERHTYLGPSLSAVQGSDPWLGVLKS